MSQYKDSRPLNVDFDFDSLDILCPLTVQDILVNGTLTLNPNFPFTQNTWPRIKRWVFSTQAIAAAVVTPLFFLLPVSTLDTFSGFNPILPFSNYFSLVGNTLVFNQSGHYHIRLEVTTTLPMGANVISKIYMLVDPNPGVVAINTTSEASTLAAGDPPTSNFQLETTCYRNALDEITFNGFSTEAETWTFVLSVSKLSALY